MKIREPATSEITSMHPAQHRGDDLHLSLSCPQCGASGWVPWTSLKRGMACPQCHCHFHVARNGQLKSNDDLPRLQFRCPRCRQAGSIPTIYRVRKARCGICKLPLEIGPDKQLHGTKEAAQLRRVVAAQAGTPAAQIQLANAVLRLFYQENGKMRTINVVLVGILAVGLLAAVVAAASSLFARTPEAAVREFTYLCLAGDWDAAEEFLAPEDAVALVEFRRWRSFYFTSILDKHRPAGDTVRVFVEREDNPSKDSMFIVTLTSPVVGKRTIRENWHERDGKWEFDVVATLVEMNAG